MVHASPHLRLKRSDCGSYTQRILTLVALRKNAKVCSSAQLSSQTGLQSTCTGWARAYPNTTSRDPHLWLLCCSSYAWIS